MTSTSYNSTAIAAALKAKSKEAFGQAPTASFDVTEIQHHVAQLKYKVTAKYSSKVFSTPVHAPVGDLYSIQDAVGVMQRRQQHLLADAGNTFRERVVNALKAKPALYKGGSSFTLYEDSQWVSSIEDCHTCAGQGSETCSRCSGSATHMCDTCNARCTVQCTGCYGSGYTSQSCLQCGGSGNCAGQTCPVCRGSGRPQQKCYTCHGDTFLKCSTCNGSAYQTCQQCQRGQITCRGCNGVCVLTYAYRVDIVVSTSVAYNWSGVPDWMDKSIKDAMASGPSDIFKLTSYETAYTDPHLFVGIGHVEAGTAKVAHAGASGECKFIGDALHPVFLDGILSGAFKTCVEGVSKPKDISAVAKASNNNIAATLIKEVEKGGKSVGASSPVTRGIVSVNQASAFLDGRKQCQDYITASSKKFSVPRVAGYAVKLTAWLSLFYLLLNAFGRSHGLENHFTGHLGISVLIKEFPYFVLTFFSALEYSIRELTYYHSPWRLLCYAVVGWISSIVSIPLLFPRLSQWMVSGSNKRLFVVTPIGMLILSFFLALYPSTYADLTFGNVISLDWIFQLPNAIAPTIRLLPQIAFLALGVAVVRYKVAGDNWYWKMTNKISPAKA